MLPVSILPVAGILLGFGGIVVENQNLLPFLQMMKSSGEAIFFCLPLIFAIGVTLGLTENEGASAIAAVVGFVAFQGTMVVMGFLPQETGVMGGILVGYLTARLFNRFYRIELPAYLGFFNGRRFVPIVSAIAMIGLGLFVSLIWPGVKVGLHHFSSFVTTQHPALAGFIYGSVERALLPFGLHHIWNVPFFFQAGDFITATGELVHGEIPRFFYRDPSAGILGGGFLFKMWGLPAAALAMWQTAKPEQKVRIGGIMTSAALASFLTGITEPIEFSFLFLAPVLYGVHALLAGLCFPILTLLEVKLGFTFSQGAIDYGLFYFLDSKPWMVLILGPATAVLYYWTFKIVILKFNLKTPGREDTADSAIAGIDLPEKLLAAMGGKENLQSLDACISRLRIQLKDPEKARTDEFKRLGASGVLAVGNNLQVVFGPRSESLKNQIQDLLGSANSASKSAAVSSKPSPPTAESSLASSLPAPLLAALGGSANISECQWIAGTRLRVSVKDPASIDNSALKKEGVLALVKITDLNYHLIFAPQSSLIKKEKA